ncbi:PAS domain-containing protein, partial [Lysobacter sp. 2RAB21]
MAAARIGLAVIDGDGRIVFANPCFSEYLAIAPEAAAGLSLDELIAAESRDGLAALLQPAANPPPIDATDEPLRWRRIDGETLWAHAVLTP